MNITVTQNRQRLIEGRTTNIGFAFCKRVSDTELETVQPISPCKDYLNDQLFTEHTGHSIEVYGFKSVCRGIFKDATEAYLAITMYGNEKEKQDLANGYKHIEKLLNYVENLFEERGNNITTRTVISQADNNKDIFILSVPLWWCQTTHLISLYSLLIRMGQFYDGEKDEFKFLTEYNHPLDKNIWQGPYDKTSGALVTFHRMLKFGVRLVTPQELYCYPEGIDPTKLKFGAIHNLGILSYK